MKIDGSVAVVTGAGSGIGRAIAAALASAGASVVVGDINAASAAETAAMIGGVAVAADAASTDGIAALLDTARRQFGPVDIYVANAGIVGQPGLGDDEAAWDQIIDINVRAHIRAAKSEPAGPASRMAGAAVTGAGAVISPNEVADLVVQAIIDGTFLVLPHPEVLAMFGQKAADHDRWIAGMRRYQRSLR